MILCSLCPVYKLCIPIFPLLYFKLIFLTQLFPDERIIEYDIDTLVYEARSPFQKIQIMHSKTLGNMLILDELQSKWGSRACEMSSRLESIEFPCD